MSAYAKERAKRLAEWAHEAVLETLTTSAPGLTEPTRRAIAISVRLKCETRFLAWLLRDEGDQ